MTPRITRLHEVAAPMAAPTLLTQQRSARDEERRGVQIRGFEGGQVESCSLTRRSQLQRAQKGLKAHAVTKNPACVDI